MVRSNSSRLPAVFAALVALPLHIGCGERETSEQSAETPKVKPRPKPAPGPAPAASKPPQPVLPSVATTFEETVARAAEVYAARSRTFFCGCSYTKTERVARGTCGYKARADEGLSKRITWARVVPAREFGSTRACWAQPLCQRDDGSKYSGLQCCTERDPLFRAMAFDLHNLVPVIAEVAQDRSNFPFGEIKGETRMYGSCNFEVDRDRGLAELGEKTRGDVARTYLYMRQTYGDALPMTPQQLKTYQAWHQADPADEWEVERNARISEMQGIANLLVGQAPGTRLPGLKDASATPGAASESAVAAPKPAAKPVALPRAAPASDGGADKSGPRSAKEPKLPDPASAMPASRPG